MTLTDCPLIPSTCRIWWQSLPTGPRAWFTIALMEMRNNTEIDWRTVMSSMHQEAEIALEGATAEEQIRQACIAAGTALLLFLTSKDVQ